MLRTYGTKYAVMTLALDMLKAAAQDMGVQVRDRYLPITIIEDGHLFRENLRLAGKDEAWVRKTVAKYRSSIAATWLLTVDQSGKTLWQGKEQGI